MARHAPAEEEVIPLVAQFLVVLPYRVAAYNRLMSGAAPPSQARA